MAEYIEREKLQEALKRKKSTITTQRYTDGWNDCLLRVKSMVHSAPAADVEPVRHGKWEQFRFGTDDYALRLRCSCCCEVVYECGFSFCPNCGARCDLGGADNG